MNNVHYLFKPKPTIEECEKYSEALSKKEYFSNYLKQLQEIQQSDGDNVLGGMFNAFGGHKKETRELFLSFLNKPSSETWSEIRNYLIDPVTTSWQVWVDFDDRAPRNLIGEYSRNAYPSPDNFLKYVKNHRDDQVKRWTLEVEKADAIINSYESQF